MRLTDRFREQPVLNGLLVLLCTAAVVLAVTAIGPASQSSGQTTRTATAKRGVVQSTVSGSGNVQSANQLDLGFKTSGTVTHIYVKQGQHVTEGQLLATLDPQSAEVTLEQAKATLQSAEANLVALEENEGETTGSQGASGAGAATANAASTREISHSETTATSKTTTTPASTEASKTTQSAATREANLASARAAVKSDKLTVSSDERAVQNTKLYAPADGTIVSLSGEVGQTVSATGTTKASSATSNSSSSSTGSSGGLGGATGKSTAASAASPSGGEGSSSGSPFMVLSNLEALQLVVALSESEIGSVRAGQIATVTIEALGGRKVAAHVVSVGQAPTSTSGAVSYDVTFGLDQGTAGLKVGMSATAEVVIKQETGINVPTSAIKAGSVTVLRAGKQTTQSVTTGLAGDSSTIVLSGLNAGETVVLPSVSTSAKSGISSLLGSGSRLGRGLGGGGLGGGGGAFPVGGAFPGGGPP